MVSQDIAALVPVYTHDRAGLAGENGKTNTGGA